MYRHRDPETKASLVEFMNGAVPQYDIKWGHIAAGAAIGYFISREVKKWL